LFDFILWITGVGRTSIARALAKDFRVASIEAMLKSSSQHIDPAEDADYRAAISVTKDTLEHRTDVIAAAISH